MQNVLALVLGGGRGTLLYPLTQQRSKAAVPIAGKYRLIDIPLSNCLNSGLNRVYVLTQYLSVSLHRHIGTTYKFDPFSRGFVEVLPAQVTNEGADWFKGGADAVRQNIRYLHEDGASQFLILSDDQLYRFDFRRLLQAHRDSRADVTIVAVPVTRGQAATLGIVGVDDRGRIKAFVEKPQDAKMLDGLRTAADWLRSRGAAEPDRDYLGNTGIYLFNREALFDLLNGEPIANEFATEIFPRSLRSHHFQAYLFNDYWGHLDTIQSYHAASLALAGDHPPFDFHTPDGVIYTRMRNLPASRVSSARLEQCLISDGCLISPGASIERCVLGVRSLIGRNVVLRDAVLLGANDFETEQERVEKRRRGLPPLGVDDDSVLERVIVDKNCRIGRGVQIINRRHLQEDEGDNYVIRDGIVVLPQGAVIPDGTVI